ncbi:hypothetical protein LCGC14_0840080 [marine sediment metagenome]|uniref:Uncharacterized protein n=1 Tax=marine sediment metagenome TaxID=412755 RepID=A0A0F9PDH0_9ZZZZ
MANDFLEVTPKGHDLLLRLEDEVARGVRHSTREAADFFVLTELASDPKSSGELILAARQILPNESSFVADVRSSMRNLLEAGHITIMDAEEF